MLARSHPRRGSVLLLAVILVIVVLGLAGSYLAVATVQSRRAAQEAECARARWVATGDVAARGTGTNAISPTSRF